MLINRQNSGLSLQFAMNKKKIHPEDIARRKRIGENLRRLRQSVGIARQQDLADKLELSRNYIGRLESGHASFGSDAERKFAKFYRVDISEFYKGTGNIENADMPGGHVPLISWVQAGKWHEAIDSYPPGVAEDWIPYETKSKGVFALRVKGSSMEPEYRDGDMIMVNPQIEARIGDDVIAKYRDNEVTFKRLKKQDGTVLLSPLNPVEHEDIIITGKDLKSYRIIGVVEGLLRRKRRK